MKLTLRKILTVLPVAVLAILFTGAMISCSNDSGSDNGLALLLGGNKQTSPNKEKPAEEVTEPVFNTRTEALDFIFGTDKLQLQKLQLPVGSGINCLNIMILIPLTKNVFMQNTALKRMVKSGQ